MAADTRISGELRSEPVPVSAVPAPATIAAHTPGPWIEWSGGECPVHADALVNVRTADGDTGWEQEAWPAGFFAESNGDIDLNWWHVGNLSHDWRIIAYRVVQS